MQDIKYTLRMSRLLILCLQMVLLLIIILLKLLYMIHCWNFRDDFTHILSIFPVTIVPSFVCVSVVDSWKSFCFCWLNRLVKRLSFKLWSVRLSWSSFSDCWNYGALSSFIKSHWFFSLCGIGLIISLRNVFLVINWTLIEFPMFWN